jgi:CRISPR-associated endonuclease Csn1
VEGVMRVFGFDVGTTSIGFAAIDLDEHRESGKILRLGARIFPEARDADGTPLNQQRRAKRMMRRQLRRRRQRRRSLNELLATHGLLPAFGSPEWEKVISADPYALRAKGLRVPLPPHELGRALYHLAKRRHFKERDPAESDGEREREDKETAEEAKEEEARESFIAQLRTSGATLGQALALRDPIAERKRGEHATRALVQDEFERLLGAQAPHHPALRDRAIAGAIEEAIFAQRSVFWRKSTLGRCPLVPGAVLCPKSGWISQQRRMLEKVNNLALVGGNARPLDDSERAGIVAALSTQKAMSWGGVREALKPIFKARGENVKSARFNLEYGDEKGGLKGNLVEAALAKIFGANWESHPRKSELRRFLPDALWQCDYREIGTQRVVIRPQAERATRRAALVGVLTNDFGASLRQAQELAKLHFPQGWEPYSTNALERILPELERGVRFGALIASPDWEEWRKATFPDRDRPTGELFDRLPSPKDRDEQRRLASLRNPTVVRVQNELRKVVNNLIGCYGKPDLIRIELARTIGLSKEQREERTRGIRANERRREAAAKDLTANGLSDPKQRDIDKWMLWQECQKACPYTGDPIGFDDLFQLGRFDIEHIWPRSICFDDGLRNETLCRRDVNIAKGNHIPFEYFRSRPDDWARVKDRLDRLVREKTMPRGKAKRFVAESMKDDFAARQLNDTGYAARQALTMLKRLWPDIGPAAPVNVRAVTGRVTAQLRKLWHLNHILADDGEKTRADHRHHAIDALAVACAHDGYTQKLSRYFELEDSHRKGFGPKPSEAECPPPWPTIRQDAQAAADAIIVSHRVRKKVSGPLHDEKPLGYAGKDITKSGKLLGVYTKRVGVEALSLGTLKLTQPADITRNAKFVVRDEQIRRTLFAHLEHNGGSPEKSYPPYPRVSGSGPEIRKVRVLTTQQKELMRAALNGFVDPASNHHIAIYRLASGAIDFETASLFDVAKRLSRRESIVKRKRGDNSSFLMSLAAGDAVEFPSGDKAGFWIVQGAWANGQVVLVRHTDARPSTLTEARRLGVGEPREEFLPTVRGLLQRGARKITIDPIGRVRPAND